MVAFGVLLLLLGALVISAAVFVSKGTAEILGFELNAMTIFMLGVAAGAGVILGLSMIRSGTKRAMRERKERKKIDELSIKLEQAQAERMREASDE
jgi:hypothetical protein